MKKGLIIGYILGLTVLLAAPAMAEGGNFGVSVMGGWAFPTASDALPGRDGSGGPNDSDFKNNWTAGVEALYKTSFGLQMGLGLQYLPLTAEASRNSGNKTDFVSVDSTALYALARYQYPVNTGLTGHFEAGLGINFAKGDKESAVNSMQQALGRNIDVETENALIGLVGAGVDYYFCPSVSLGLNLRYWWSDVDYDLKASGLGVITKGTMDTQSVQTLLTLTYWFGN